MFRENFNEIIPVAFFYFALDLGSHKGNYDHNISYRQFLNHVVCCSDHKTVIII